MKKTGLAFCLIILLSACTASPPEPAATPTFTEDPVLQNPTNTSTIEATPTITLTPSITPTPTLGVGSSQYSAVDGMLLLYVPAGEFIMGEGRYVDSPYPFQTFYLDAFWIDQTEVTNRMFLQFAEETGYFTDAERLGKSSLHSSSSNENGINFRHPWGADRSLEGLEDHPVVHVSWNDAAAYCEWAGRRLPTEAEWEKAARGTEGQAYPWGSDVVDLGLLLNLDFTSMVEGNRVNPNDTDDGYIFTAPVGSYPAGVSPYGALDISGNVSEWVSNWYQEDYYENAPYMNPQGPVDGVGKIIRDGNWSTHGIISSGWRISYPASLDLSSDTIGFRCAMSDE